MSSVNVFDDLNVIPKYFMESTHCSGLPSNVWDVAYLRCCIVASSPKQAVRVATQYASAPCKLIISSHWFARWHLFWHVGYIRHQQQVWLFDFDSGVRVTCDVGYLCANFSLPRPVCSRLMPDVRDRQTSDAHHRLMPPTLGVGA